MSIWKPLRSRRANHLKYFIKNLSKSIYQKKTFSDLLFFRVIFIFFLIIIFSLVDVYKYGLVSVRQNDVGPI